MDRADPPQELPETCQRVLALLEEGRSPLVLLARAKLARVSTDSPNRRRRDAIS